MSNVQNVLSRYDTFKAVASMLDFIRAKDMSANDGWGRGMMASGSSLTSPHVRGEKHHP